MAEIDTLLSDSLKRLAQPGDAAGVADAIRSRVDAGDTGTPAQTSGFGSGNPLSWLPWVGLVVLAGLVGGSLAPLGVFGAAVTEVTPAETAMLPDEATAYLCIEGAEAAQLPAGQRVLAVGRSDDSTWLGVRDPLNVSATLWLPAGSVVLDTGQDAAALPTGGTCPTIETTLAVPVPPAPKPAPTPTQPAPNPGPGDTTAPAMNAGKWLPEPIYGQAADPYCDTQALIVVSVTDSSGIASVTAADDRPEAQVTLISVSGSDYTFAITAAYNVGPDLLVNTTFTATDNAGNQASLGRSITVVSAGNCVI